jgi:hypothetical protein
VCSFTTAEESALSTTWDTACVQSSRKPSYGSRLHRQWLTVISATNIAVILKIRGVINIDYVLILLPCFNCVNICQINIIANKDCHCITAYLNGTTQITMYLYIIIMLVKMNLSSNQRVKISLYTISYIKQCVIRKSV